MYFYNFEAFTSPCELHIDIAEKALADNVAHTIYENTKSLETKYSFFTATSELYPLNNRRKNSHTISDELSGLIKLALFYADKTDGAFDIATAGTLKEASLVSTIQEYNKTKEKLLPFASAKHIDINNNSLTFSNSFTKIDLGGLVKEFAVDEAIFLLKEFGAESALVNFGGDVAAYGNYNKASWCVGIQNPKKPQENLKEVTLNGNSLCTSGHSKCFRKIESEEISHIISKNQNNTSQISVIAPTTTDAGVWSTSLLINPDLVLPSHIKIVHTHLTL